MQLWNKKLKYSISIPQRASLYVFWMGVLTILQWLSYFTVAGLFTTATILYGKIGDVGEMPEHEVLLRAWNIWFFAQSTLITTFNWFICLKLHRLYGCKWVKINLYTLSFFSILTIFHQYKMMRELKSWQHLKKYFSTKVTVNCDVHNLVKQLKNHSRLDNISKNTIVYLVVWLFVLTSFILLFAQLPFSPTYNDGIKRFLILNTFSYFTKLTNMICFFYVSASLLMKNQSIFRKNRILIYVCAYIMVVSVGYWGSHVLSWFNGEIVLNYNQLYLVENLSSYWYHTVVPVVMLVLYCFNVNLIKNERVQYSYIFREFLIFPFYYAIYLYSVPFIIPFSVYGVASNANPDLVIDYAGKDYAGSYYILFAALGICGIFLLACYIHLKINNNAYKKKWSIGNCEFNYK
ncbi:MAG: hypothetical protein ACRC42_04320 [Mycoplasma sp.]